MIQIQPLQILLSYDVVLSNPLFTLILTVNARLVATLLRVAVVPNLGLHMLHFIQTKSFHELVNKLIQVFGKV